MPSEDQTLYSIPKKDLDALRESLNATLRQKLDFIEAGLEIMVSLELSQMEERLKDHLSRPVVRTRR